MTTETARIGAAAQHPSVTLDPVDLALIDLLREDGRATFSDMGNEVSLSGEAIRHRIDRLERGGVIKVVGSVSPEVLGYRTFAGVAINVSTSAREVAEHLAAFPATDFVVSTAGDFDILVEVVCKDDDELLQVLDEIRAVHGVQSCQTFLYLSFEKYGYDTSGGLGGGRRLNMSSQQEALTLDQADMSIIQALREDGRASYTDLAAVSGLTYPSARRRVLRLLDTGVLHINTMVNRLLSQGQVQAGIGVTVSGDIRAAAKDLAEHPEVGMIITTSGRHDLMLEVTCRDKADLADFVGSRLRSIQSVVGTHTYTYLHIHKLPYTWSGLT
ncbi:DNA-binding transcriptional regulator, Lrp family [Arthrobacter sp. cf158]|uniref:Lrp/AsnC family transcriptional regulator n=1 Tax=Arthrobacter sp. cf158 TaxID=1761744 RepID=UPI0008950BBE|nr:Lrp/AsnC family transcriptional regulator [Arthrobacter sp. cf158]SDW90523.1 DNA-binding transcriptional regulator, Lrp family [Arthrobacter sp. cf158]